MSNMTRLIELDMEHLSISLNDQIGVFDENICIGIAIADFCPLTNKILFPLMIYSNHETENDLTLKLLKESNPINTIKVNPTNTET